MSMADFASKCTYSKQNKRSALMLDHSELPLARELGLARWEQAEVASPVLQYGTRLRTQKG